MSLQPAWLLLRLGSSGKLYTWLPIIVFGLLAALFHAPYLHWFPQGIHEWAQSDRLSLAYGFYDRGFNLLLPRSLSLTSIDGVVGVEFPGQAYVAALLGLVVGRSNISLVFRLLDTVMMTAGCCFLFKLVFESTRNVGAALVPGAFLLSSPIFAYYAGNYLPDPFGVSLLFVSFYYLHRYYYRGRQYSALSLGLALATLATLIKLSLIIYLGSISFIIFVVSYLRPTLFSLRQKVLFVLQVLVSVSLVGGWILYMRWLNKEYASWIFLSDAKPLRDKSESDWVLKMIEQYMVDEYFTFTAYWVLRICLVLVVGYAVWRWRRIRQFAAYAALLLLAGIVIVPFYVAMGTQFAIHDYYAIAPLMPLAMLLVLGGLFSLQQMLLNRWWAQLPGTLLAFFLLYDGYQQYERRMQDSITGTYRYHWVQGGARWLDQAGVPTKARILVLGQDDAPNLSLSHFQRAGIVLSDSANRLDPNTALQLMTQRNLRYVVVRASMLKQIKQVNPVFLTRFKTLNVDEKRVLLEPLDPLKAW